MIAKRSCLSVILVLMASITTQTAAIRAQDSKILPKQFLGEFPPELISQKKHWLEKSEPVTQAAMKGRVIWLQFNFSENCTFSRHQLVKWEEEFGKQGLSFVEVSGGKRATFDESDQACAAWPLRHSVLWDEGNQNHQNYGIRSWPSVWLIAADGKVFWQGNPNHLHDRPEELQRFRSLLEEHLKKVSPAENAVPPNSR